MHTMMAHLLTYALKPCTADDLQGAASIAQHIANVHLTSYAADDLHDLHNTRKPASTTARQHGGDLA